MNKKQVAITLGIMCLVLVFCIMVQLNTIEEATNTVGQTGRDNSLKDEVLKWKEKYDKTYSDLESAESELENQRNATTGADESSQEKQKRLKELNTYLGLTDVTGSGIIITIQDNRDSKLVTANDLVHDEDIRRVVNEIKNIGADAISVNGQRIVQSTVINCAGAVAQVNGETVGSPFVIEVIGDEYLYYNITRPGSWLNIMEGDGVDVNIKKSDNITIKKYNGVLTNKYLKNAE